MSRDEPASWEDDSLRALVDIGAVRLASARGVSLPIDASIAAEVLAGCELIDALRNCMEVEQASGVKLAKCELVINEKSDYLCALLDKLQLRPAVRYTSADRLRRSVANEGSHWCIGRMVDKVQRKPQ